MERARSQNGGPRSSPGTPRRTGRRVSVAYGDATNTPNLSRRRQPFACIGVFRGKKLLQFFSCTYRRDFAFALMGLHPNLDGLQP